MKKIIDLLPIVGSQVLCEFWDNSFECYGHGFLEDMYPVDIAPNNYQYIVDNNSVDNCRIYHHPDYWISNQHGELKLPEGLIINLARRDADEDYDMPSGNIELRHIFANDGQDVIAVQVTGLADGWEWEI